MRSAFKRWLTSVTEFNADGTKPKIAYANNKDFKKIVKYYSRMRESKNS